MPTLVLGRKGWAEPQGTKVAQQAGLSPLGLTLLLLLFLTLPHFVYIYFKQSSLAVGLAVVAGLLGALYLLRRRPLSLGGIPLGGLALATLSTLVAALWVPGAALQKPLGSVLLLAWVMLGSSGLWDELLGSDERLKRVILYGFLILALLALLGPHEGLRPGAYALRYKPIFPFPEESYFALTYGLFAAALMMQCRLGGRLLITAYSLAIALWYPSFTLLVISGLLLLLALRGWVFLLLIPLLLLAWIQRPALQETHYYQYFAQRADLREVNKNLTMRVYMQGWEQAYIALRETHGMGVGFQNLGIEPAGHYAQSIQKIYKHSYNRLDGGHLGAKLIGELGMVGLLLVGAILVAAGRAYWRLGRNRSPAAYPYAQVVQDCLLYLFVVQTLFRGISYLDPVVVLYLFALRQRLTCPQGAPSASLGEVPQK